MLFRRHHRCDAAYCQNSLTTRYLLNNKKANRLLTILYIPTEQHNTPTHWNNANEQ